MSRMNRREAIRQASLWAGVAALWASLPTRTWAALALPAGWSAEDEALLNLIGDTIVPTTAESPGAGAVGIGRFMIVQATDCYAVSATETLRRGLKEVSELSRAEYGKSFDALSVPEREKLLTEYEAKPAAKSGGGSAGGATAHPFRLMKELTVLGYCTSESGATQALRYLPVPGGYNGAVKLAKGDRSWAL